MYLASQARWAPPAYAPALRQRTLRGPRLAQEGPAPRVSFLDSPIIQGLTDAGAVVGTGMLASAFTKSESVLRYPFFVLTAMFSLKGLYDVLQALGVKLYVPFLDGSFARTTTDLAAVLTMAYISWGMAKHKRPMSMATASFITGAASIKLLHDLFPMTEPEKEPAKEEGK